MCIRAKSKEVTDERHLDPLGLGLLIAILAVLLILFVLELVPGRLRLGDLCWWICMGTMTVVGKVHASLRDSHRREEHGRNNLNLSASES